MYKIVICGDDKNFISYMKEMLLRCDLSEHQVAFYEVTSEEECLLTVEKMNRTNRISYIVGKNHTNIVKVSPDDILYIDNYKRGSEIHVRENYKDYSFEDRIMTKKKLAELYTDLKEYGFEYAHNSYIVNLNHVVKFKSEGVIKLSNGKELNVSRSKMPEFRQALAAIMNEKHN